MSANNIACLPRHRAVIAAADTAAYTLDGIVRGFQSKIIPVDYWPGIVTGRGTAVAPEVLAPLLADYFVSFDDMVEGIETALPVFVEESGLPLEFEMNIAGWSEARQAPECYSIATANMNCTDNTAEEIAVARAAGLINKPFKLAQMPFFISGPPLRFDTQVDAGADHPGADASIQDWTSFMRLQLEAQRQQPDRKGLHWVGGEAEIAIVTPAGVEMKVVHEWAEDQIDELVKPAPIDWTEFRVSIGLSPGLSVDQRAALKAQYAELERRIEAGKRQPVPMDTAGKMSRLQRQRMEKKARKATLRAV